MQIKIGNFNIRLRWLLIGLFVLILLMEFYFAYVYLYSTVFREKEVLPEGNVVRVNLKAYEATVDYLESLYDYQAPALQLPRANPFQ